MTDETGISPNTAYPSGAVPTIDAPQFNNAGTELKLEAKSVRNTAQAYNICKGLEFANRQRNARTASIQALYDGQPPFSAAENVEKAAAWRANASTLWLAGIVDRVSQRLVNAVISQTYVTASSLPDNYPQAKTKSDFMRAKFTQLVRGWDGNTLFINSFCKESSLQGYCYSVFLDPTTWNPSFFKQDELFVPEKSGQHARDIQFFCCRRDFRLDTFIELFRDEKAAEAVGYDLKNCLEAANKAGVKDTREDATTTQFRSFVEMIDEGTQGLTMGAAERVVKCWMLFNREYDGKISFWLLQRDTGAQLRFSFKLFNKMQEVLTMFSFEAGNGCIHSSKGLGRKLAALSIMKELFRCGIIDNSRISGLMVIKVDAKDKTKFAPSIVAPFCIVDKSVDIADQQFQTSADSYKIVDTMIDAWAEQAVGAYLAAQITEQGRTERTATEATIDARRENESSDIMIRRTLDQDSTRIQMQQYRVISEDNLKEARRIYTRLTTDTDVKPEEVFPDDIDEQNMLRFLVECYEFNITEEELMTWSKSQASAFAHVTETAVQRGVAAAKETFTGNPNIDQQALDYAVLESLVGAEKAKVLFVPGGETTQVLEAQRKQQMESAYMAMTQSPIEVSPRDNHLAEAPEVVVVLKRLQEAWSKPGADPRIIKTTELNLNHLGSHLEAAAALGQNKNPVFGELEKFYQAYKKQFAEVVQIQASATAAQQMVAQSLRTPAAAPAAAPAPASPAPVTTQQSTDIPGDFEGAQVGIPSPNEMATV